MPKKIKPLGTRGLPLPDPLQEGEGGRKWNSTVKRRPGTAQKKKKKKKKNKGFGWKDGESHLYIILKHLSARESRPGTAHKEAPSKNEKCLTRRGEPDW